MDKKILFFITFLLLSCTIFAQKGNQNPTDNSQVREEYVEAIINFSGDFSISEMKELRENLSLLNVTYLGYCVDQKSMIIRMVKKENVVKWAFDKISRMAPGKVVDILDYEVNKYAQSCQLFDVSEASFFKSRIQQ